MLRVILFLLITVSFSASLHAESSNPVTGSQFIVGELNFLSGYPAIIADDIINVVIEIPAGTVQKWEVSADGSTIHWELDEGKPRIIKYLPYPANYGMIPGTTLSKNEGGDGDPLDVILLSKAIDRGSVVQARPIAVLRLSDQGEKDDKILAVPLVGPLSSTPDLGALKRGFPGITESLEIWFSNYKGGGTEPLGMEDAKSAWQLIRKAAASYQKDSGSVKR
jgi:inorganic pyrophosphatase